MATMIDAEILENLRALEKEGNAGFVRNYFSNFLGEIVVRIGALRSTLQNKESKKLSSLAHALKSSCANSGIDSMMQLCKELENEAAQGILDNAGSRIDKIEDLYKTLVREVQNLPEYASQTEGKTE